MYKCNLMWSSIAVVGVLTLPSCVSLGRGAAKVEGCYVATPALTISSSGTPERGDPSFALLQLMRGGRAMRPLLARDRTPRGTWRLIGDTLQIVVAAGFTGWSLLVRRDHGGWVGDAQYRSDALVVGAQPYRHAIVLRPHACVGSG